MEPTEATQGYAPPGDSGRGRGRSRRAAIVLLLIAIVAALGLTPHAARADSTYPPADLLNPETLQGNPLYQATAAQQQSLANLEQAAVSNVLQHHQLPAGDAAAAQSWGRPEALAELWYLIIQAIKAPACTSGQTPGQSCRSTDQQNVVDWMAAVNQRSAQQAAQAAGLEYVKWAGLDQNAYQNLLAGNPSQSDIKNFLQPGTNPNNYAGVVSSCAGLTNCVNYKGTNYSEGYCAYHPPAPYQGEFDETGVSSCFVPCTSGAGCTPAAPKYDQLVKWGAADATYQLYNSPEFQQASHDVAVGFGFGIGLAGAVAATTLIPTALAGWSGTVGAASTVLFPFAATAAVTSLGVASVVLIAVAAAVIGAFYAIQVFDAAALPGQLATLIINTRTTTPDLTPLLGDSNGETGLYALFIGATLPTPTNTTCDNSQLIIPPNGIGTVHIPAECLNAPSIPAQAVADPDFAIQAKGSSATTYARSISWSDTVTNTTNTARVTGNWFIDTGTSGGTTSTAQTLHIHYTDWNGNGQTAWLVDDPNATSGYQFLTMQDPSPSTTVDPSTCIADQTCAYSPAINFVGTDGHDYSARVVSVVPHVSITLPTSVTEGTAATFQASATSPVGTPGFDYEWQFEQPMPPGFPQIICIPGPCPPNYGPAISGASVSYTFTTSGTYHVQVTATDANGVSATAQGQVTVADVPPQLSLLPAAPTSDPSQSCFYIPITPCQMVIVPLGSATALYGSIAHAGSSDNEAVSIDWGDNSSNSASNGFNGADPTGSISLTDAAPHTSLSFKATHTYANQGSYLVKVTATDQSGATDTKTITEHVVFPTSTTVSSSITTTAYGQPVTFTAAVTSSGAGTPTGTVEFWDGSAYVGSGQLAVVNGVDQATFTTSSLSVGNGHSMFAVYDGDSTFSRSISSTINETVNKADTTTAVAADNNPSVWGQPVTFTATVAVKSPGAETPSGTVTFYDGAVSLGTGTLSTSNGTTTATLQTSKLAVSSTAHTITASYSGDGNFNGSKTTSSLAQLVKKAATSTKVSTSNSAVTHGKPVTFTAPVSAVSPGAGTPTGTVTFSDGTTVIGTGTLSASSGPDQAAFSTSGLAVGAHSITASYGGDGNFNPSASSTVTQYINTDLSGYPTQSNGAYNLSASNLMGGYFVSLNLSGASLSNANMMNAVFIGANLSSADLSSSNGKTANFSGVNFTGANLSNANLKGANFTGANLIGANLANSNLMGATGLSTATLTGVVWTGAMCPDGTSSAKAGGSCIGHL